MPKHCVKYQLEEDDGEYFHSGVDGSLYMPDNDEFHSNEDYCVDYFYYKDKTDPDVDKVMVNI